MAPRPTRWVGALCLLLLSGCSVELQHDLTEDDANDIYVLLQKNDIDVKKLKEEGGNEPRYTISVGKQDVQRGAELLREYSLPRPKADGLAVFKKMKGMIPTQTEERAMFVEALGGEVANALNRIPGVLEARCIVMIPETNDLTQPANKPMPSASVFIKYRAASDKLPVSEADVKAFVASAVPELKKEAVNVLMVQASIPVADDTNAESRTQTVLGFRMTKSSADQFKVMLGVGVLVLALGAAAVAFLVLRRPKSNGSPRPRTKTNNAAEG